MTLERKGLTRNERLRRRVTTARYATGVANMGSRRMSRAMSSTGSGEYDPEHFERAKNGTLRLRLHETLQPVYRQMPMADGIGPSSAPTAFAEKGANGYTFAVNDTHYTRWVVPDSLVRGMPVTVHYEFYPITTTFTSATFDLEVWLYRKDAARPGSATVNDEQKLSFSNDTTTVFEYGYKIGQDRVSMLMFQLTCTALDTSGGGLPGLVNIYTSHYDESQHQHSLDELRSNFTRRY